MGHGLVMLLLGFLAGGAAASVVWAVIVSGRRRAVNAQRAEREQIMASMGETLAEADAIETGFRSGALPPDAFRRALGEKINAVMRQLRTNMHALDPFFVKYAEQEAREYLGMIDNPERRRHEGMAVAPAAEEPLSQPVMVEAPIYAGAAEPEEPELAEEPEKPEEPETDLFAITPATPETAEPSSEEAFRPPLADTDIVDVDSGAADTFDATGSVDDTADDFEPSEPAIGDGVIVPVDTGDEFEPSESAIGDGVAAPVDAGGEFEPSESSGNGEWQVAAPAEGHVADAVDTLEDFEPQAPPAIREEELVLGESVDGVIAAQSGIISYAPPMPPAAFAAPPPALPSVDEFEAAFEQFEPPAAPAPIAETPPPVQILPTNPTPSEQEVEVPLAQLAQHIEREERREQQEHQGITGDDVVDSIDNFFKLN